jgi:hypothetical protein
MDELQVAQENEDREIFLINCACVFFLFLFYDIQGLRKWFMHIKISTTVED